MIANLLQHSILHGWIMESLEDRKAPGRKVVRNFNLLVFISFKLTK